MLLLITYLKMLLLSTYLQLQLFAFTIVYNTIYWFIMNCKVPSFIFDAISLLNLLGLLTKISVFVVCPAGRRTDVSTTVFEFSRCMAENYGGYICSFRFVI